MRVKATLITCVLLSVWPQANAHGQSGQAFPSVTIALQEVRNNYHVRTGFEMADADRSPVTLDLSGKDISQVFNSLVKQKPAYDWSLQDGVYDLYPKRSDSLSQLMVLTFVVTNVTREEAQQAVFDSLDVKQWFSAHHAKRNDAGVYSGLGPGPGGPFPEPKRASLSLSNVPVRTVLNRVILKFDRQQWIISHRLDSGETDYISIEP